MGLHGYLEVKVVMESVSFPSTKKGYKSNKRFEFKKLVGRPMALETQIAWKSLLLTKIILRRTLLVEKTVR